MSQAIEHYVDVEDDEPIVKRRSFDSDEMDITPMIDITFLLLIFFIVASRVDKSDDIKLPDAQHGTAVSVKSSIFITIGEGDGEKAVIYKGDGKSDATVVKASAPEDQEQELVDYLQEGIDAGKSTVVIKAEKNVKHGEVSRVSKAVGKIGNKTLFVAVLETQ